MPAEPATRFLHIKLAQSVPVFMNGMSVLDVQLLRVHSILMGVDEIILLKISSIVLYLRGRRHEGKKHHNKYIRNESILLLVCNGQNNVLSCQDVSLIINV